MHELFDKATSLQYCFLAKHHFYTCFIHTVIHCGSVCRCIDVAGAYSAQKTELNISLTAIGLLWTATDFIVKGLAHWTQEDSVTGLVLL